MRKRNHVVPVRLNAKELRHLDEQVAKSGLSREEFMRSLILGAQLHTKPCEHHADLLRKIAGLFCKISQEKADWIAGTLLFLSLPDGCAEETAKENPLHGSCRHPKAG